jgi:hypothetical protein
MRTEDRQQLCRNTRNGTAKVSYRTAAAARKIQKRSGDGGLSVYGPCRYCAGYHVSSQEQRSKIIAPPSAKTLRGILENQAREIAACQRRVRQADERLAAETAVAQEWQSRAEQAHAEELRAIDALVSRLRRV